MRISRAAAVLLLISSASIAAPGGGGSGSAPSMSAPEYDPSADYRKGVEALQARRFQEAKKALDRVLQAAPRDANTHFLAGLANAGLGDLNTARKHYERALKADKELVDAQRELGITHARLGDRAKAEAALAGLKRMQEKCNGSCAKAAQIGSAIEALTAALGSAPQAGLAIRPGLLFTSAAAGDGAYLKAVSLINEGRYEAAIVSLEDARTAFGPHPDILTYLGFANRRLGHLEKAETFYKTALAAAPEHRGATEYYGELMVERGDLAGASVMLARLERICTFGCAEADELRRWINARRSPAS